MKWLKIFFGLLTVCFICTLIVIVILVGVYNNQTTLIITVLGVIIILYLINVVFGIYVYFDKKRRDLTKKSWLYAFLLFPGLSAMIFLWTGFTPFTKKKIKKLEDEKQNIKQKTDYDKQVQVKSNNDSLNRIFNYCSNITFNKTTTGKVEFIKDKPFYNECIDLIRSANKYIFINFYIVGDGVFLRTILNELYLKVQAGVKVYFLYDWVGARKKIDKDIFKKLSQYGIKTVTFKKKSFLIVNSMDNSRNHKKSIIVDGKKGIVGGFNIADEYINEHPDFYFWRDHGFTIEGQVINDYLKCFLLDWKVYTNEKDATEIENTIINLINENKKQKATNHQIIQSFNSFPEKNEWKATNVYAMLFNTAKKRIWINSPYFYLPEELKSALINAASSGVDVRLILPGLPDNKTFITDVNRSKYQIWINNNFKVYEFNGFTHTKSILVDDDISILGTVNMDPRALNINYEIVNIVESKKLFNDLENEYLQTIKYSTEILTKVKEYNLLRRIYGKLIVLFLMLFEPLL